MIETCRRYFCKFISQLIVDRSFKTWHIIEGLSTSVLLRIKQYIMMTSIQCRFGWISSLTACYQVDINSNQGTSSSQAILAMKNHQTRKAVVFLLAVNILEKTECGQWVSRTDQASQWSDSMSECLVFVKSSLKSWLWSHCTTKCLYSWISLLVNAWLVVLSIKRYVKCLNYLLWRVHYAVEPA